MNLKTTLTRAALATTVAATLTLGTVAPANAAPVHTITATHVAATKKLTTKQQVLKVMNNFKKDTYNSFTKQAQKTYTKAYIKKYLQISKVTVKNSTYKFHNTAINIDGKNYKQYATITAKITYKGGHAEDYDYTLVKEGGKWKIAFIIWHF